MDQLNVTEVASTINNARDKALATVKKYSTPKTISAIIELAISTTLIFGMQLIAVGFDFSQLKTWGFWLKLAALDVAVYLLYRAVVNARYGITESRPNVVEARDNYNEKNKRKGLDFKTYLKYFNLQTKTEAYVYKINHKINKLENKAYKTRRERKINKLEYKINNYKKLITSEYIQEHIERIKIKYTKVYWTDFNDEHCSTKGKFFTRDNYNRAFTIASLSKMWMYVLSSIIIGIMTKEFSNKGKVDLAIGLLMASTMVITRITTALFEADRLYDANTTASMINRANVLDQYFKWQEEHPTASMLENEKEKIQATAEEEMRKYKEEQDKKLEAIKQTFAEELTKKEIELEKYKRTEA